MADHEETAAAPLVAYQAISELLSTREDGDGESLTQAADIAAGLPERLRDGFARQDAATAL